MVVIIKIRESLQETNLSLCNVLCVRLFTQPPSLLSLVSCYQADCDVDYLISTLRLAQWSLLSTLVWLAKTLAR